MDGFSCCLHHIMCCLYLLLTRWCSQRKMSSSTLPSLLSPSTIYTDWELCTVTSNQRSKYRLFDGQVLGIFHNANVKLLHPSTQAGNCVPWQHPQNISEFRVFHGQVLEVYIVTGVLGISVRDTLCYTGTDFGVPWPQTRKVSMGYFMVKY